MATLIGLYVVTFDRSRNLVWGRIVLDLGGHHRSRMVGIEVPRGGGETRLVFRQGPQWWPL